MARSKHRRPLALYRPSAPKPIVIKTTKVVKAKRHHRKGHGAHAHGLMNKQRMGIVAGAFIIGMIEKQGMLAGLPALPFIGATGTIGVAAYLLSDGGKNRLADEVCTAAFVMAAHELATAGKIVGDDPMGVSGVDYVAGY